MQQPQPKRKKYKKENVEKEDPDLHFLDLQGRDLDKITKYLNLLKGLKEIDISKNWLSSLPKNLSDCSLLSKIVCANNCMNAIDVGDIKLLHHLDCRSNHCKTIKLDSCVNLQHLNVQNNLLSRLDLPATGGGPGLRALYIENNILKHVPNIPQDSFSISASSNHLHEDTNFACYTSCRRLYLQNNKIYLEHENRQKLINLIPPNIEILNMSGNTLRWFELPEKISYAKLEKLYLVNNKMERFILSTVQATPRLCVLDISNNDITQLDISALGVLHTLHCKSNHIENIILPQNSKLRYMDISYNRLENLDFFNVKDGFAELEVLDLESNLLKKVSTEDMCNVPNILQLNVSKNCVEKISKGVAGAASKLQTLYASNNPLCNVPSELLESRSLQSLFLQRCPIEEPQRSLMFEIRDSVSCKIFI